jgi:hypothetical protein
MARLASETWHPCGRGPERVGRRLPADIPAVAGPCSGGSQKLRQPTISIAGLADRKRLIHQVRVLANNPLWLGAIGMSTLVLVASCKRSSSQWLRGKDLLEVVEDEHSPRSRSAFAKRWPRH